MLGHRIGWGDGFQSVSTRVRRVVCVVYGPVMLTCCVFDAHVPLQPCLSDPTPSVCLVLHSSLGMEVIPNTLLARAHTISTPPFLSATAACFIEPFTVADSILAVPGSARSGGREGESRAVNVEQAEDVMCVSCPSPTHSTRQNSFSSCGSVTEYSSHDYLNDEMEELKRAFETIWKGLGTVRR